jgi:hypothetical protein
MAATSSDTGEEKTKPPGHPCFTARGVRRGALAIAPLAMFVMPFGIAFGGAAAAKAVPASIAMLMSGSMFAGAAQFAALDLWRDPLPLAMLALTVWPSTRATSCSARRWRPGSCACRWRDDCRPCCFSAIPISRKPWRRASAASRCRHPLRQRPRHVVRLARGTAIGAYGGAYLGDLARFGFDAVMVSYFAAVVLGQWKSTRDLVPWIAAAAAALLGSRLLPPGWHIIVGALAGGVAGAWRHGR